MIKFAISVLIVSYATTVAAKEPNVVGSLPRLPSSTRMEMIRSMEQEYKRRNDSFLKNTKFTMWQQERQSQEILDEFDRLQIWRESVWYLNPSDSTIESHQDFKISQDLMINNRYRYPRLIAFAYNVTDPSYNSSTITLNGLRFLALEAPSEQSLQAFNYLMHNHKVTHLVRLTPAYEKNVQKSVDYWKDNVFKDPKIGVNYLNIPLPTGNEPAPPYTLQYVWTDNWIDHASGAPQQLQSLIEQARRLPQHDNLIAVHCHSGVARTGTFIAGYLLLHEIDQQLAQGVTAKNIKVSIEKIVKQLSLQRYYMVGQPKQYETLYRLVDNYIKSKQ